MCHRKVFVVCCKIRVCKWSSKKVFLMFSFYLCSRFVENKEIVRRFIAKFMVLLTDLFYKCMQTYLLSRFPDTNSFLLFCEYTRLTFLEQF